MRRGIELFGIAGLLACAGLASNEAATPLGRDQRPTNFKVNDSTIAGQFRASASAWLWRRTDHYLQGRLTQGRNLQPAAAARVADRRGLALLFADWEAAIAGRDPQRIAFRDPQDALPLFRLMTWLDPQFLPGWTTGARVIAQSRKPGAVDTALAFLSEGIVHNPDSPSMFAEQGYILAAKAGDVDAGSRAFEQAIEHAGDIRQLSEWDREAVLEACRFAALLHRRTGRMDRYYEVLRFGVKTFQDDLFLQRLWNGPHPPLKAFGNIAADR